MLANRILLAALCCACLRPAQAQAIDPPPGTAYVDLVLSDLKFAAISLDPAGGVGTLSLSGVSTNAVANLLGEREERHAAFGGQYTWAGADAIGASTHTNFAASVFSQSNFFTQPSPNQIDAHAALEDPLSQWYHGDGTSFIAGSLRASPQTVLTISGHLKGREYAVSNERYDTHANGVFSLLVDGAASYSRSIGASGDPATLDEFFTLTFFNRSASAQDFHWQIDSQLTVDRALLAVPEPASAAMLLAGLLVMLSPGAAGALRRGRTRGKYQAG